MTAGRRGVVIAGMLGRVRRTTRLDVGLALSFAGLSYLIWALVAGVSRAVVQEMIKSTAGQNLPKATHVVKTAFVDVGIAINVVGLLWLLVSLVLLLLSSRQRISIGIHGSSGSVSTSGNCARSSFCILPSR